MNCQTPVKFDKYQGSLGKTEIFASGLDKEAAYPKQSTLANGSIEFTKESLQPAQRHLHFYLFCIYLHSSDLYWSSFVFFHESLKPLVQLLLLNVCP